MSTRPRTPDAAGHRRGPRRAHRRRGFRAWIGASMAPRCRRRALSAQSLSHGIGGVRWEDMAPGRPIGSGTLIRPGFTASRHRRGPDEIGRDDRRRWRFRLSSTPRDQISEVSRRTRRPRGARGKGTELLYLIYRECHRQEKKALDGRFVCEIGAFPIIMALVTTMHVMSCDCLLRHSSTPLAAPAGKHQGDEWRPGEKGRGWSSRESDPC